MQGDRHYKNTNRIVSKPHKEITELADGVREIPFELMRMGHVIKMICKHRQGHKENL
jgi:hypothetical protein